MGMDLNINILVTGGAGYIGSVLTEYLLNTGYSVTVVDNFMFGQVSLNHVAHFEKLSLVNGDVRDATLMASLVKDHDVIIPLAAYVGAPLCSKDPIAATAVNRDSILNLLALKSADQIVLMPTTNSAYGTGDQNNFCTEESPLNPISHYAVEKVEVERVLMDCENVVSFRLATVFGMSPRMRLDLLVNDFCYRAANDGYLVLFESQFKRNYIHVRDVCMVFQHSLNNFDQMKNNIFNVGLSSANMSKLELAIEIRNQVPDLVICQEEMKKDPDQRNYVVSNVKLEKTGWQAMMSLQSGITELLKGFKYLKKSGHSNI